MEVTNPNEEGSNGEEMGGKLREGRVGDEWEASDPKGKDDGESEREMVRGGEGSEKKYGGRDKERGVDIKGRWKKGEDK